MRTLLKTFIAALALMGAAGPAWPMKNSIGGCSVSSSSGACLPNANYTFVYVRNEDAQTMSLAR